MKPSSTQPERLRRLLRAVHHQREEVTVDDQWTQQTLDRIRRLADDHRPSTAPSYWETYFWRWFAAGGMATAILALMIVNFQWIPDGELWSFLFYENETLSMMQAYLY